VKTNGKGLSAWLLCLTLSVVLWAALGCQKRPEQAPGSSASAEPSRVTVEQVQQWMAQGMALVLLDSRSDASWSAATTKAVGSLRVPPNDVAAYLSKIPRVGRIIVYCT
jgi:hypothetical protein